MLDGKINDSEKTIKIRQQLLTAKKKKFVVKFGRPYERSDFTGYVIDVGSGFFLLASLGEGLEFEQFTFLRIADAILQLLEIDPDAEWETEPSYYRVNQITRIDLPGLYEQALLTVAGEPKVQSK